MKKFIYIFIAVFILVLPCFADNKCVISNSGEIINKLSFEDLVSLSAQTPQDGELLARLNYVLYNPIIDNTYGARNIALNKDPQLGDVLRVASWNIDRGLGMEYLQKLFSKNDSIMADISDKNVDKQKVKEQIDIIRQANIIVLNEVDIGMPRTGYKNIAHELAKILGYNYAFGTEFVEVDPTHLGLEDNPYSEERILFQGKPYIVDKSKYKGLHGNAILSQFPIKNVRMVRLPAYYDWFGSEKKKIAELEFVRREAAEKLFREDVIREIRQGSRIAMIADIEVPGYETPVIVVAVHLENRVIPKYRYEQIKVLLDEVKKVDTPLILAGDFNTTTSDGSHTSISREIKKKLNDPQFLVKQIIVYSTPYSFAVSTADSVTSLLRTYKNPVVRNFPVISPNKERKLFKTLQHFKFDDGNKFDFRGNKYRSSNGRTHLLANSNQRDLRGFTPTFIFERPLFIGKYKLDWIFVKPLHQKDKEAFPNTFEEKLKKDEQEIKQEIEQKVKKSKPQDIYAFDPFYGRTLLEMNYAFNSPLSDHSPITVDTPLNYLFNKKLQPLKTTP